MSGFPFFAFLSVYIAGDPGRLDSSILSRTNRAPQAWAALAMKHTTLVKLHAAVLTWH